MQEKTKRKTLYRALYKTAEAIWSTFTFLLKMRRFLKTRLPFAKKPLIIISSIIFTFLLYSGFMVAPPSNATFFWFSRIFVVTSAITVGFYGVIEVLINGLFRRR